MEYIQQLFYLLQKLQEIKRSSHYSFLNKLNVYKLSYNLVSSKCYGRGCDDEQLKNSVEEE